MSRQALERILGCLCVWWGMVILWPGDIYGTTSTFRLLAEWGVVSEEVLGGAFLFIGLARLWASFRGGLGLRAAVSFLGLFDWVLMMGAFAWANHAVGPTFWLFESLFAFVLVLASYVYLWNVGEWLHKSRVWRWVSLRFGGKGLM